jgi:hypothetical protein
MDEKIFFDLMELFEAETVEILGNAKFAVEVVALAESRVMNWMPFSY